MGFLQRIFGTRTEKQAPEVQWRTNDRGYTTLVHDGIRAGVFYDDGWRFAVCEKSNPVSPIISARSYATQDEAKVALLRYLGL